MGRRMTQDCLHRRPIPMTLLTFFGPACRIHTLGRDAETPAGAPGARGFHLIDGALEDNAKALSVPAERNRNRRADLRQDNPTISVINLEIRAVGMGAHLVRDLKAQAPASTPW